MVVTAVLSAALVCFGGECYPALFGLETPVGVFQLRHYAVDDPRYGGDALIFDETPSTYLAVHRVLDIPGERRRQLLKSDWPKLRRFVTHGGCINLDPAVYAKLVDCCSNYTLRIEP